MVAPLDDGVVRGGGGEGCSPSVWMGGEVHCAKAAAEPPHSKEAGASPDHASSCYQTSHPAENRRMGHPVLYFCWRQEEETEEISFVGRSAG